MSWSASRPLLVIALLAPMASAQDAKDFRLGAEHVARTLTLVAADEGLEAARELAGGRLPPTLAKALAAVAQSKRTADLRSLPGTKLKAAMLPEVLADVPGAKEALEVFARDAGARAARELGALDARCRALSSSAKTLQTKTKGRLLGSRVSVRSEPDGPLLLLFSAQNVLLRHTLSAAKGDHLATYETLSRLFDRPTDALAELLFRLLPRAADNKASAAVGKQADLRALAQSSAKRLAAARSSLASSIEVSTEAVTQVRDEELRRVLQGDRAPHLAEFIPVVNAYRKEFNEPPALKASAACWDVYEDTRDRRLHFWLAGEGRWVRGQERVDDLAPVQRALLDSPDPAVQREATHPRTLATVYGLFEARSEAPFAAGWEQLAPSLRAASEIVSQLRGHATAAGLNPAEFELRMATRLGVSAAAFAGERTILDRVLTGAAWRGQAPALELLASLEQSAKALEQRPPFAASITLGGEAKAGSPVDLVWTVPKGLSLLTDLPEQRSAGETVFLVGAGAGDVAVRAHGWAGRALFAEASASSGDSAELALGAGKPSLVAVGEQVRQLPTAGPLWPLVAAGDRPLRPSPGGGTVALGPLDAGGKVPVSARDPQGGAALETVLELDPPRGVVLGPPDAPVLWVSPGSEVVGRMLEGGRELSDASGFALRGDHGELMQTFDQPQLQWVAKVPYGRYEFGAKDDPTATPFGVTKTGPRVSVGRTPLSEAEDSLRAGEGAFLRLAPWPVFFADEVLEIRWTVEGAEAISRPRVGLPGEALLLPVLISPDAKSGDRKVTATVVTARGNAELTATLRVSGRAKELGVELRTPDGPVDTLASGEEALLVAGEAVTDARWTLLGPTGPARLLPRFDGQVPLALEPEAPVGDYSVWVSAERNGERVFGKTSFSLYAAQTLSLTPPARARVGETVTVAVDAPPGFDPPYEVRAGNQPWAKGKTLAIKVLPENDLWVAIRDGKGHQARARLRFKGEQAAPTSSDKRGPRFGIAANVKDRRIFAAPYDLLLQFKRNDTLPPALAILELGPLTAAGVRDRIFGTVPYDGAAKEGDKQDVYQSERFWEKLQRSARERLEELDVTPGTPFTVRNSPSPGGEETLLDVVGRHLDENGGWTFELISVRVRADGAHPAPVAEDPKIRARMQRASINETGSGVRRVVVPGPLGSLELLARLPEKLELSHTNRVSFSLTSRRAELVDRPYPADWHLLARRALLVPELSVEVELAGETLKSATRGLGKSVATADVVLELQHQGPERDPKLAGSPRVAEKHRVRLEPLGVSDVEPSDHRFPALSPGSLTNVPEELIITLIATQQRGVSVAAWPKGREKPELVTVEGVPLLFETQDVPQASIELKIRYLRVAPGGKTPPPARGKPLGGQIAGPSVEAVPGADAAQQAARAALSGKGPASQAEAACRLALAASEPDDPRPWGLLADGAWAAKRPAQARARARWALGLGDDERAWLVLGEAALSQGELDGVREALKGLGRIESPSPSLEPRWAALRRAVK